MTATWIMTLLVSTDYTSVDLGFQLRASLLPFKNIPRSMVGFRDALHLDVPNFRLAANPSCPDVFSASLKPLPDPFDSSLPSKTPAISTRPCSFFAGAIIVATATPSTKQKQRHWQGTLQLSPSWPHTCWCALFWICSTLIFGSWSYCSLCSSMWFLLFVASCPSCAFGIVLHLLLPNLLCLWCTRLTFQNAENTLQMIRALHKFDGYKFAPNPQRCEQNTYSKGQ